MRLKKLPQIAAVLAASLLTATPSVWAGITTFNLQGTAGPGLLPGNEPAVASGGTGGAIGAGIFFDDSTSVLTLNVGWGSSQGFTDLSSLANNSHIHVTAANFGYDGTGNFKQTGGVAISLTRSSSAVTGGTFTPNTFVLTAGQKTDLFNGKYYVNIHTANNGGGETRGFLVPGLTQVNIFATNAPPGTAGTYTPAGTGAGTLTSDGRFDNNRAGAIDAATIDTVGDVTTFAYEMVTNDFDKRVKLTSIVGDASDYWARGALQVRTGTSSYSSSLQVLASNPLNAQGGRAMFHGRCLDGQNYTTFSRYYDQVTNALPKQWIRLRRVGDYFSAYLGTNGTDWTLIGEHYQVLPAQLYVGPSAASGTAGLTVSVGFTNYGNTLLSDGIKPTLVSAGTLDKKIVGVRFSEAVSSATAKVIGNYSITQGVVPAAVTITGIQMGISGDAVYLSVLGLTNDNFTVKVLGGIQDTSGNTITPNQSVAARALNWNHADLGYIQNTASRPTPGDDPHNPSQAVMVSSDENPEIEIIGGGSNQWNPGDFVSYIWRGTPVSGNFDVTVAVSRNDRAANYGGYGNSGLMLRATVMETTNAVGDLLNPIPNVQTNLDATKSMHVANTTYQEGAGITGGPDRAAIPLWRTATFGGYGNGGIIPAYGNQIGGVMGYYGALRGINASGQIDPNSIPDSARYLRIVRSGTTYSFYTSFNRTNWAFIQSQNLPTLPDQLFLGFSTMNDSGGANPPSSAYGGNGHGLDPADPYNPAVVGGNVQNESSYSVQRIKVFPNGVTDPLPAPLQKVDIRPLDESPTPPNAIAGSWTSTGTYSFDMTGGGTGLGRNLGNPPDGTVGGDELTFAYETLTGDFDKQVQITSLTNLLYNGDGSPFDYTNNTPPVDTWARAGLVVRNDPTNSYAQCLKILAANPAGANAVRVMGRGIDGQNYTTFSGDYAGVSNALPKQYLRMKRVGNNFSCYVS